MFMYICVCVYMNECRYVCMYVCIYVCMFTYMHVYIYVFCFFTPSDPKITQDYEGQKLAERLFQHILVVFSVVGFLLGLYSQELSYSIYTLGAGVILSSLVRIIFSVILHKSKIEKYVLVSICK